MRVADYIVNALYDAGAENAFLITGGMIMHLTDALKMHGAQRYVCCHHEQAAAMAADAYGRYTGKLGVAYVTAGPGALNTLTGVVGAYVDSAPCIIVAGQSKVSQAQVRGPRQFSLQGYNTLSIFEHVTKYAVMLDDVSRVRYEVEKCIHLATSPRVGPVWLEVPLDIQGAPFDPSEHEGYDIESGPVLPRPSREQIADVAERVRASRRPCLLIGAGVRLAEGIQALATLVEMTGIPVMTSRLGMDLLDHEHPLFVGRPGTYGDRASNFTIQNSDLLLSIGCRLGIGLVGYDFDDFARHATVISVDVDDDELSKPSVVPAVPILSDARVFLEMLTDALDGYHFDNSEWVTQTQRWKARYPVNLPEYTQEKTGINSYLFLSKLSEHAPNDALFLVDTGSCFHVHAQAFKVKFGQRHIITGGLSTMGYAPASIGVAAAAEGKNVYCVTGDGSIQFNLQELQTIVENRLPIKLILLNNDGYLLMRITQNNFFERPYIGADKTSGVSFPDMEKIAGAYGIDYMRISELEELDAQLDVLFSVEGPLICEVMTPPDQVLIPRVSSKKLDDGSMISMPYDDMFPFLPRDEYARNNVRDTIT